MVALGAKGSFPSSTDDATKPKNIIALSNPHTRTTGFQGTRMYMANLRGRRAAHDYLYYRPRMAKLDLSSDRSNRMPDNPDGKETSPPELSERLRNCLTEIQSL